MKQKYLPRFLICTFMLLATSACAPKVKLDSTISPEDLGMSKYTFQDSAKKGFVVVWSEREYDNARLVRRYETVSNTCGATHKQTLVFVDCTRLRGLWDGSWGTSITPEIYIFNFQVGSAEVRDLRFQSSEVGQGRAKFTFADSLKKGKATIVKTFLFTIKKERYEDVKKRIPNLSNKNEAGWTYCYGYPIPQP